MSRYNNCKTIETLADQYGNDMRLYGMSMYWSSRRVCEDTTSELVSCDLFKKLGMYDKNVLLTYGQQMKQYGMGCYKEYGAAAEMYNKYYSTGGVPNPFKNNKLKTGEEQYSEPEIEPGQ